jgi:hypothetical protein
MYTFMKPKGSQPSLGMGPEYILQWTGSGGFRKGRDFNFIAFEHPLNLTISMETCQHDLVASENQSYST